MVKINDDNYNSYKQAFETIWHFVTKNMEGFAEIDPTGEYSPVTVLNNWEKQSKTLAKKGLQEGLRDSVTMSLDMAEHSKRELNQQLVEKNLPSFYHLVSIIKDIPKKVLKRGKIKNLEQYYVIKEFLVDITSDLSDTDRSQLEQIFADFENNYGMR